MPELRGIGAKPSEFTPIAARTRLVSETLGDRTFDFSLIGFVRAGSLRVVGDFRPVTVVRGDVIAAAPGTGAEVRPAGESAIVTTLAVDRDLIVDSTVWEFSAYLRGRPAADHFLARRFPGPITHVRIGDRTLEEIEPWLDELATLTASGEIQQRFKRAASLLFAVLDAVEPALVPPAQFLPARRENIDHDLTLPRHRVLEPLRPEVRRAAELMEADPARAWTLDRLAGEVGLSPNHLRHMFVRHLGKSPWAYLNLVRAQRLGALLLDLDVSIPEAIREVGWSQSHGAKMFRRYAGMTPRQYRHHRSRPTA